MRCTQPVSATYPRGPAAVAVRPALVRHHYTLASTLQYAHLSRRSSAGRIYSLYSRKSLVAPLASADLMSNVYATFPPVCQSLFVYLFVFGVAVCD